MWLLMTPKNCVVHAHCLVRFCYECFRVHWATSLVNILNLGPKLHVKRGVQPRLSMHHPSRIRCGCGIGYSDNMTSCCCPSTCIRNVKHAFELAVDAQVIHKIVQCHMTTA